MLRWPVMAGTDWPVAADDEGVRLDKFLAHADAARVARARAFAALDRGKVYVNDADRHGRRRRGSRPATPCASGWTSRAARGGRLRPGHRGDLDIVYEDDVLIVVNKPAGLLTVPLERKRDVPSVYDQIEQYLRPAGQAAAARRAPHRSGHLGPGGLRQGCRRAGAAEGAVQAARAGARLLGRRLRPARSASRAPGAIGWCGTRPR